MRFTNNGGLPHEFAFARIEEGKTEADVKAVIESGGEPPEWAEDVAGVPGLSPGQSISVTRTLEPGNYVFLCFFPDPEGTPHANLGMYELFTIAGDTGAALPEPDATITATDDGLQVPALTTGEQTVQFENGGTEPHELALVAFEPGKGIKDVDRWFGSGYQGEPPVTFLGGMQTIRRVSRSSSQSPLSRAWNTRPSTSRRSRARRSPSPDAARLRTGRPDRRVLELTRRAAPSLNS